MLVRLLYASRVVGSKQAETLHDIMHQSHSHNPANGVTGILCYSDKVYMQVLEGGRTQINALYARILHDPRHTDVVLLDYQEISERRYACWTMGQANLAKINASTMLRFAELPEIDPHAMSGKHSLALIDELTATATIVGRP